MEWLRHFEPEHGPVVSRVRDELHEVEALFDRQIRSDLACVRGLAESLEFYRGKMLRPTMVLLSGMAASGEADDVSLAPAHRVVAAVTEMIHVATLVHDDVLDDAEIRRRGATVNKLRGNEAAVILGDYLISSAFELCSGLDSQSTARRIGQITTQVCEGELLQLDRRGDFDLDEATYFEIIRRKTASLIGVACELGAAHAGADQATRRRFMQYGAHMGVAFQIQDDILDLLGEEQVVGKSLGKDLEKGKLTLPLIRHLATCEGAERRRFTDLLRELADARQGAAAGAGEDGAGPAGVVAPARDEALAAVRSSGSIESATEAARQAVERAKQAVAGAPGAAAGSLLEALADASIDRRY